MLIECIRLGEVRLAWGEHYRRFDPRMLGLGPSRPLLQVNPSSM
jgi:hypothetical protein